MSTAFGLALSRRGGELGVPIPPDIAPSLEAYFALLSKWNRTVNLTSLPVESAGDEAIDRLLLEPIAAASHFPAGAGIWVDLGSGGGSPAIPLKLLRPATSLIMVEAKSRKVAFLREAIRTLQLRDVQVQAERFEALARSPRWRPEADVVTARAVRRDPVFVAAVQAVLRAGGTLMVFGAASTRSVEIAGFELVMTTSLPTPNSQLALYRRSR